MIISSRPIEIIKIKRSSTKIISSLIKCIKDNGGSMGIQQAMEYSWNTHEKDTREWED